VVFRLQGKKYTLSKKDLKKILFYFGFSPGYLTAFQVRKMSDQNRISVVNSHNLYRCKILPEQIATACDSDNVRYQPLIHPASSLI